MALPSKNSFEPPRTQPIWTLFLRVSPRISPQSANPSAVGLFGDILVNHLIAAYSAPYVLANNTPRVATARQYSTSRLAVFFFL
jgi:hypothetical protein